MDTIKNNKTIFLVSSFLMVTICLGLGLGLGLGLNRNKIVSTYPKNADGVHWIEEPLEKYTKPDSSSGLKSQIDKRAFDNTRTTVHHFGASVSVFSSIQVALSIVYELQLNSDKEIVLIINDLGESIISKIDWTIITDIYQNVKIVRVNDQPNPEEIYYQDNIFPLITTNNKIDLHVELAIQKESLDKKPITDMGNILTRLETYTYFTDGQTPYEVHNPYYSLTPEEIIKEGFAYEDVIEVNNNMNRLRNNETLTSEEMRKVDLLHYATYDWDNDGNKDIYSYAVDDSIYEYSDYNFFNYTNHDGLDLYSLIGAFNQNSLDLIKELYEIDGVDFSFSVGKENNIYSGKLLSIEQEYTEDKNFIIDMYNDLNIDTNTDVQIVYKSHPRSTDADIDRLISEVETQVGKSGWIHRIDHTIPMEAYLFTGSMKDDDATSTTWKHTINGTSTLIAGLVSLRSENQISVINVDDSSEVELVTKFWGEQNPYIDLSKISL